MFRASQEMPWRVGQLIEHSGGRISVVRAVHHSGLAILNCERGYSLAVVAVNTFDDTPGDVWAYVFEDCDPVGFAEVQAQWNHALGEEA